jgi:tetratricopeptide (TPR) repeat protein
MEEQQQSQQNSAGNFNAIIQGSGNATVNINMPTPTLKWLKPLRLTLGSKPFVGREELVNTLITELSRGNNVAITGKQVVKAFQGMGGIGKTYLALKLAIELYDRFPGGILRIDIGPQVTDEASAQVTLGRLASYAFGGFIPLGSFQPEQVATWLAETAPGPFLVIFDDLWHPEPLRFLNRALPPGAVQLVTTRFTNVAQAIGAAIVPLDRLSPEDGLALLEERLHCQGNSIYQAPLEALARLLGGHALALEIAAAQIKKPARIRTILHELEQGIGRGTLSNLKLTPGDGRNDDLERSFALSYENLILPEEQHLFRTLGVFVEESLITADAAAAVWGMSDVNTAQKALYDLADLALLTEVEETSADTVTFRQHSLLRVYARALIEQQNELADASRHHAQFYTERSWQARTSSPPDYEFIDLHLPNILAVLQWSENNDLELFTRLLDAIREYLLNRGQSALLETYLPQAIAAAQQTGNNWRSANLLKSLGDLESRLGNIDQARAHYDAALLLFRTERARLGEANVYMSLGDMFMAQEAWEEARSYYEKALSLYTVERDPLGLANTLIDLGRARFELGDHAQGLKDVQQAATLFHRVQSFHWAKQAEQRLAEMHRRLQKHSEM